MRVEGEDEGEGQWKGLGSVVSEKGKWVWVL